MPVGELVHLNGKIVSNFGTERDGAPSQEYCKFCYVRGKFTMPDLTVVEMMELSIENMTKELQMSKSQAISLAQTVIPKLKRWANFK